MQIAAFIPVSDEVSQRLVRQIGVEGVLAKLPPNLTGDAPIWDLDSFARQKARYEKNGLRIVGLEGDQIDMRRIKFGLPGRDEDIERYQRMLGNMGELGIGLLCYNFMVGEGWFRSSLRMPARGGALVNGFDSRDIAGLDPQEGAPLETKEVWANYEYFIRAVLPVAEASGVVMGAHPDDPPIPELRGIGRIFSDVDGFRRAMALSDSPSHKITFCQANFKLMTDDVIGLVAEFGESGRIAFVHWRDVAGEASAFRENFHDEDPDWMIATLKAYRKVGFDGPIRVDHVPALEGEGDATGYTMLAKLNAIGYLKGILDTLERT